MNWIIRHSKKLRFHTDTTELFKPFYNEIKNYNWIITDLEFISQKDIDLPIDLDHNYFILSPDQFKKIIDADIQIVWGVISGVPIDIEIKVDEDNLPFTEGNKLIWKDGNIQYLEATVEITCFDSDYTIIKFKDKLLSDAFKKYFDEAIELEKF